MATDAFGRLRTSDVFTLFEYYPSPYTAINLDNDMWIASTAGTASASYNSNTFVALSVSANSSGSWRRSKAVIDYQPGKSRQFMLSMTPLSRSISAGESVTVRNGVYLPGGSGLPIEGMYLVVDENGIAFAEAKSSIENIVRQSNWNIDKFDGNGPSGLTLTSANMTNCLLVVLDQEWLGVGRVRCGFNLNGVTYYAHQFTHNNIQTPYTTTPRLPITYGIHSTTLSAGAIATHQICCTAVSEGGFTPLGRRNNISTTFSGVDPQTANVSYVVLGVRLQTTLVGGVRSCIYPTGILKLQNMDCLLYTSSTSANAGGLHATYEIQLHNSLTGIGSISNIPNFIAVDNSIAEKYQGDGNISTLVSAGYPIARFNLTQRAVFDFSQSEYETLLTRNQVCEGDTLYVIGIVNSTANNLDPRFMCSLDIIETV